MKLIWTIDQKRLNLSYAWKISRNTSNFKINSIVTVTKGKWKGIGEGAPNIRYDETPEKMALDFDRFIRAGAAHVQDLHELENVLNKVKVCNALRFAIESAYIHCLCHADQTDIYTFLGIQKPVSVATSYSLPIMEVREIKAFYDAHALHRFTRLKVKVNAENAYELIREINAITRQPLIVDGNEAWKDPDQVVKFMESLQPFSIALIEQPMPADQLEAYKILKPRSPYLLFADESICADADFDELKQGFHGINMKLMKAGGYLNGIRLLNEAVKHQLHTMVGCMVETTLGISSAFHLCAGVEFVDLDGFMIVQDEPFGLIRESEGHLSLTAEHH